MDNATQRNQRLQILAEHIADEQSVDWAHQLDNSLSADPAAQGLREMEQIAQGFRHLQLADNAVLPTMPRFQFGALQVLDKLGCGSQGEVWRAYDPMLDMRVALKLRRLGSDHLGHEFLAEARRLARIRHANIVSVYGAAVEDGRAGLWMELIHGTTLAELFERDGRFASEDVRQIGLDLCRTLASVHRHGLLHGDVKPENIMREVSGRIVLMDFGIARELHAEPSLTISGSMNYLAPEVLHGAQPSVASEIYAIAAVLFRLVSGEFPAGKTTAELAQTLDRVDVRHSGLRRAILRALDAQPSRRFADAMAMAQALVPTARQVTPWCQIGLVAALVLTIAGVIGGWSWRNLNVAASWDAQAGVFRLGEQANLALPDGSAIALGDKLVLAFRSNRPAYVYVFDDDGSADIGVLFPLPGLQTSNPLAANTDYQLPGRANANQLSWQVSRAAKRDVFVVLASDAPLAAAEAHIRGWHNAHLAAPNSTRGALDVVATPLQRDIDNPQLRAILQSVQAGESSGHVRHWRISLPHRDS